MSGTPIKSTYVPLTAQQAIDFLTARNIPAKEIMSPGEAMVYAEILRLHARIDDIENQANEMMSPDKMMELASGFLGKGLI